MKKIRKILFGITLILISITSNSQTFGQDSDGYSNIIVPTTQLNLDIANKVAIFEFVQPTNNNKYLIGARISGKTENDVSVLFSEKKIAGGGSLSFIVGQKFTRVIDRTADKEQKLLNKKIEAEKDKDDLVKVNNDYIKNLVNNNANPIIRLLKNNAEITDGSIDKVKISGVKSNIKKLYKNEIEDLNEVYATTDDDLKKAKIQKDKNEALPIYNAVLANLDNAINVASISEKRSKEYVDFNFDIAFINHLLYARGGFNGNSFRYDLKNDSTTIEDRFAKKNFNGWNLEIGYNFNWARTYFGLSLETAYLNNLSGLDEVTYSLRKEDQTITGGTFTSTETIEAFEGDLDNFNRHTINIEATQLFPVSRTEKGLYISLHGFMRHRFYNNAETIKDNFVLGGGLYAISTEKNQLLGGLFVQTNDLFGANTEIGSALGDRIVFGLVAKFAFKGVAMK